MNIMVIGGGGREHAMIKKLKENKALLERQRKKDPIRLRSKGRGRGR